MNINISNSIIDAAVKRQLASIGKRAVTEDGKKAFSEITLSSIEESLLHDYYAEAVLLLNTESQYFVKASSSPSDIGNTTGSAIGSVELEFPSNHNNAMNETIKLAFLTFLVAYAIYAWLSVSYPKLVERFRASMQDKMNALLQLIWHKAPPTAEYDTMLPPVVNIPGNIRLSYHEQCLFSYILGTDLLDDLVITSSESEVIVAKNESSRIFSVMNARVDGSTTPITATITITRSNTNTVLATFGVTADPPAENVPTEPVIIGFNIHSDSITLRKNQRQIIRYTGTLTEKTTSNDEIAYVADYGEGQIELHAIEVGSCIITLYGANGWRYTLNVNVTAVQSTSPKMNIISPLTVAEGATIEIPYTLGSDNINDFALSTNNENITIVNNTNDKKFVITGVTAGGTIVSLSSAAHPDINTTFLVVVTASQEQTRYPHIFDYSNGDTIRLHVGDDELLISFENLTGEEMAITASNENIGVVYDTDSVIVTPNSVGSSIITFSIPEINYTFYLLVEVLEQEITLSTPNMMYLVGTATTENRPHALTDESVELSTNEDITVYIDNVDDFSLLNISQVDTSKAEVTRVSNGVYRIRPKYGIFNVTFSYGTWSRTFNITYVQPVTVPIVTALYNEYNQTYTPIPSGQLSASLELYTYMAPSKVTVYVDESNAPVVAASSDSNVVTVARPVSLGTQQNQQSIFPQITIVGQGSATITFTTPNNPSWSFAIHVTVLVASNPVLRYSANGTDFFELTENSFNYIGSDPLYVSISDGEGYTLDVTNSNATKVSVRKIVVSPGSENYAITPIEGRATVTFTYGPWRKVINTRYISPAENQDEPNNGGNQIVYTPRIVNGIEDDYDEREVVVGETDVITIEGDTVSSAWTNRSENVTVSYDQGGTEVRVIGLESSNGEAVRVYIRTTNAPSSSANLLIDYNVVDNATTYSPRIVNSSDTDSHDERSIDVGDTDYIYIDGDTIDDAWIMASQMNFLQLTVQAAQNRIKVDGLASSESSAVQVLIRTVHAPSEGSNLSVAYTVVGQVAQAYIYGSTNRSIAANYEGEYLDIVDGSISSAASSDDSIISVSSYASGEYGRYRVYLTPHAVGTAVVTVTTTNNEMLTVNYTITAAVLWPDVTYESGSESVYENGGRVLSIGQKDIITVNNATVLNAYAHNGSSYLQISRSGNTITVTAKAVTAREYAYIQIVEQTQTGENIMYLAYKVVSPTVSNRYRNINVGDTDTFEVENGTVTDVTVEPSGVVNVSRSGNVVTVVGAATAQSGREAVVKVTCNNSVSAVVNMNYKVWPAASAVTVPSGVTSLGVVNNDAIEWSNESNSPTVPKTFLVLNAGIPVEDNSENHTQYNQGYIILRLMWEDSVGKYVVRACARNVAGRGQYFYYIRSTSGMLETQVLANSTTSQLIAELAAAILQHYGFTGDNAVVAGDTLELPYSGSDSWPFTNYYISIPNNQ